MDERIIDRSRLVGVFAKSRTDRVEIAKRRKELEGAGQQAVALKQLQQPLGAGLEEALAHRWHDDRAGVDQQLSARPAGEPPFSLRVACVAVGAGGESQQPAIIFVVVPRKQRRVFSQQLLQACDVVVVNDASSLRCRPLQPFAEPLADLRREVLPAGVAVLARDHELRVALRQRQGDIRQVRARTRDGRGVTGGDVACELLCLFTEGFQRRTSREGLRSGHCDLLS